MGAKDNFTFENLYKNIKHVDVKICHTDAWNSHRLINSKNHIIGKSNIHTVERTNQFFQQYLVRFDRKTCSISKFLDIIFCFLYLFCFCHLISSIFFIFAFIFDKLKTNTVLTVHNSQIADCINIELSDFNNSDSQKFILNYVGGGYYTLQAKIRGKW